MLCWLKSLLEGHRCTAGDCRLELTCEGLAIVTSPGPRITGAVSWAAVERLSAFKLDLPTGDLVGLRFCMPDGSITEVFECMEGFDEVVERLSEVFPSIAEGWFGEVAALPCSEADRVLLDEHSAVHAV